MRKILYISYDGASEPIPQAQAMPYLRELQKKGLEIYWISFDKKNAFKSSSDKEDFKNNLLLKGINWHSLSYHKGSFLSAKIFDLIMGIIYAIYIAIKEKVDFVHGRAELASTIAYVLKKLLKKKFIYDRRGFMAEDYIEGGMWKSRNGLNYKALVSIDKLLLSEAEVVVVLTERIKNKLSNGSNLKDKIFVIPCCVDLNKFTLKKNRALLLDLSLDDKFIFLYSGSIGTWYMLEEMVDFFLLAKKRVPNAHFLILTLADIEVVKTRIKNKIDRLDDFTIKGVPPSVVQEYISLADVAIAFIKPVYSKLSSSPTKFGECLASGLPFVINSNIGDTDKLIRQHKVGAVVENFSEDGYKKAIDEIIALNKDKEALRYRCRDFTTTYMSLAGGVNKYWEVYKKMIPI